MYCKNCGKEIQDTATFCDGCGKPVSAVQNPVAEKKKKKKHPVLGTILLIFGIILIIGALSSNSDEPEKVGTNETKEGSSASTEGNSVFAVGDKVKLNDVVVTLVDVSESNGKDFSKPESGNVFLVCEFEIENNSGEEIGVSSLLSFSAYVDDYSTQMSLTGIVSAEKPQLDGAVAAGKKMNGVIAYEVSKDWKNLEVRFSPSFWSEEIIFSHSK